MYTWGYSLKERRALYSYDLYSYGLRSFGLCRHGQIDVHVGVQPQGEAGPT